MPADRRQILTVMALGPVAMIQTTAKAQTTGGDPFEAWDALARQKPGDPLGLVAAAILSANPHDTQPWLFQVSPERIVLEADTHRHLGSFDPYRREMWLGLGCAVETMVQAGPSLGFKVEPRLAQTPGAAMPRVELALTRRAVTPDGALSAIAERRTNRAPYKAQPVGAKLTAHLQDRGVQGAARAALFTAQEATGQRFAAQTVAATQWINADREMPQDSHNWFRANRVEVARHRDGVSIPTAGLSPLMTFLGQILPGQDLASEGRYWLESTRRQVAASALFGVITVNDLYDRGQQIEAGRVWQRLHLAMTRAGLAAQPLNQLPERVDRQRSLGQPVPAVSVADAFCEAGRHVTFCFRAGYAASSVPHSARRALREVVSWL